MASTDQATSGGGEKHVHFQESCSVYFFPPTQHDYSDGDTTTEDLSPLIDHAVGKPEEECDINTFNLLPWQKQLVYQTLMTPSLLNPNLLSMAKVTHLEITPYLVYRYYSSQNWDIRKKYAGQDFHIAIMTTIHWRLNFNSIHGNHSFRGIHAIQTSQFASLVRHGLGYTGGLDQHGRVIMYAKVNRVGPQAMPHHVYLSLLMYTVERADRMCAERHKGANGEFVVVLDLTGFSIARRGLPVSVLQEFFTHTAHYPFRLSGIYLLNNNSGFSALWGIMKVLLPKRLEKLTYMPNTKAKADKLMCEHLGRNHVEQVIPLSPLCPLSSLYPLSIMWSR